MKGYTTQRDLALYIAVHSSSLKRIPLLRLLSIGFIDVLMLCLLFVLFADVRIDRWSAHCFDRIEQVPHKKLAVVLGTAKYRVKGGINTYYQYRLEAAFELYKSRKVDFLLISGDNSVREYDEPTTIKNDLIEMGIPEERIFLDYAGFRTFDSMVRCKRVFGEKDIIVVSQPFHNERALYIAHHFGMTAVGFNAKEVDRYYSIKTQLREKLARAKTILDIHVLNTAPKFLGEQIKIELKADSTQANP